MSHQLALPARGNHTTQKVSILGLQVVLRSVYRDSGPGETFLLLMASRIGRGTNPNRYPQLGVLAEETRPWNGAHPPRRAASLTGETWSSRRTSRVRVSGAGCSFAILVGFRF